MSALHASKNIYLSLNANLNHDITTSLTKTRLCQLYMTHHNIEYTVSVQDRNGETLFECRWKGGRCFATSLNRRAFTVTQRNKSSLLKTRRPVQRNRQFCDCIFFCFGAFWHGVLIGLAVDAIWVPSTS